MNWLESGFASYIALMQEGKGFLIIAPIYIGLIFVERVIYFFMGRRWSEGDAWPNIASAAGSVVVDTLAGIVLAVAYIYLYENYRLFTVPIMTWWGFIAGLVIFEGCHYFQHRMQHRMGLFWAFHSVHHTSSEMNITVAARFMWGIGLTEPIYLIFMPILGVSFLHFRAVNLVVNMYGIFNHTKLIPTLGFLEHLLMTPANHRVHHSNQLEYLDANYSQTLLVFDKVFGTHRMAHSELTYGSVHPINERNPLRFQTYEIRRLWKCMRSAPHWADKLRYLVKPPGWSHTGDHQTTEALRERACSHPFHGSGTQLPSTAPATE